MPLVPWRRRMHPWPMRYIEQYTIPELVPIYTYLTAHAETRSVGRDDARKIQETLYNIREYCALRGINLPSNGGRGSVQQVVVQQPQQHQIIVQQQAEPQVIVQQQLEPQVIHVLAPEPQIIYQQAPEPQIIYQQAPEPQIIYQQAPAAQVIYQSAPAAVVVYEEEVSPVAGYRRVYERPSTRNENRGGYWERF